jgi:hypothetical protein
MWDITENNVLQTVLGKSEHLIWSGRPKQGLMLRSSDALLIPFSLLWCGFALFWEGGVISSGAPFFFMLWGIPFVLMGLYITVGRFFVDAYIRQKTYYGLTKERVIIVSGLFQQSVKSLPLSTLADVTLSNRMDGRGTITFGPDGAIRGIPSLFTNSSWPNSRRPAPPAFEAIPDAQMVYDFIRDAQQNKTSLLAAG